MRFVMPVLLLAAACSEAPESDAWPVQDGESTFADDADVTMRPPPGVDLILDVSDVIPGQLATFTISQADPGETVFLLRSTAGVGGGGPCPAPLGGACLDIHGPVTVMTSATANAQGVATIRANIPASAPNGLHAFFEAAAPRGGVGAVTSNPVERELGAVSPYAHTILVDGDGFEWTNDEAFDTTSGIGQTWVSWDATHLYVGLQHPDVQFGGDLHWSVIYLASGPGGTTGGIAHNTQVPTLPFPATHAIRRKADGSYDGMLMWDGYGWSETGYWLGTDGSAAAEGGELLELAIPRSLLGGANRVQMHTSFVYEGGGFESTYAGTPADSFADGYDPDFGSFLDFDLTSPLSPVAQNP